MHRQFVDKYTVYLAAEGELQGFPLLSIDRGISLRGGEPFGAIPVWRICMGDPSCQVWTGRFLNRL